MLKISCSSITRNMICPASLLHEQVYVKKEESKAAIQGTEKHLEMELAAKNGKLTPLAVTFQTQMRIIEPDFDFKFTMAEEKFQWDFEANGIKARLTGKIDLIFINFDTKIIHIIDYKFGFNSVDIINNEQLLAYALLVQNNISPRAFKDFNIKCSIYQDEVFHTIDIEQNMLDSFYNRLCDMVKKSQEKIYIPHAEACKYCIYRPNCPEIINLVADIVDSKEILQKKDTIARNLKLIKYVVKDVEKELRDKLKSGDILDFCTLRSNGSVSQWTSDFTIDEIAKELIDAGLQKEDIFEVKLKSVPAIKKVLTNIPEHLYKNVPKEKSISFFDSPVEDVSLFD